MSIVTHITQDSNTAMAAPDSQTGRSSKTSINVIVAVVVLAFMAMTVFYSFRRAAKSPESESHKAHTALNVGIQINDSPGFSVLDDGQRSGFDIDLANYVANGMGTHANFVPITVASRDEQLKKGYVDLVVSTYSITDAHINNGIIFAGPYIRTDQGVMVSSTNDRITSVNDLADQTVCVTSGSTSAIKLDELKKSVPLISTIRDTLTQCIDDMKNPSTNVSAVTSDSVILQGHARADTSLKFLPGVVIPGTYEKYGIGISGKNTGLCQQVAKLLKNFVSTQWNSAFTANIQGNDGASAGALKPDLNTIDTESCRSNAQNV